MEGGRAAALPWDLDPHIPEHPRLFCGIGCCKDCTGSVCRRPSTEQALHTNGREAGQNARDKDFRNGKLQRTPREPLWWFPVPVVLLENMVGVEILSVRNAYWACWMHGSESGSPGPLPRELIWLCCKHFQLAFHSGILRGLRGLSQHWGPTPAPSSSSDSHLSGWRMRGALWGETPGLLRHCKWYGRAGHLPHLYQHQMSCDKSECSR